MRQIQEEMTRSTSQHWQSPCWYRALSLAEGAAVTAHGAVVTDPFEADGALMEPYFLITDLAGKAFHRRSASIASGPQAPLSAPRHP